MKQPTVGMQLVALPADETAEVTQKSIILGIAKFVDETGEEVVVPQGTKMEGKNSGSFCYAIALSPKSGLYESLRYNGLAGCDQLHNTGKYTVLALAPKYMTPIRAVVAGELIRCRNRGEFYIAETGEIVTVPWGTPLRFSQFKEFYQYFPTSENKHGDPYIDEASIVESDIMVVGKVAN